MWFLANSSKEYMQQNQQAVLAASWVLKTDVFCIDMLVEALPAVSDLPPAWQQNAIQYWYIFALTYGLFYPYFPVVFVYFLRILDEDIWYVSMVFFIIHVPAPGNPGARKQIQEKTKSKTRSSRKHRHKTVRSAGGPNSKHRDLSKASTHSTPICFLLFYGDAFGWTDVFLI